MQDTNSLKNIVLDVITEFYQRYIKPDTQQMLEETLDRKLEQKLEDKLEKKFDEKLDPIRGSQIQMEHKLDVTLSEIRANYKQLKSI